MHSKCKLNINPSKQDSNWLYISPQTMSDRIREQFMLQYFELKFSFVFIMSHYQYICVRWPNYTVQSIEVAAHHHISQDQEQDSPSLRNIKCTRDMKVQNRNASHTHRRTQHVLSQFPDEIKVNRRNFFYLELGVSWQFHSKDNEHHCSNLSPKNVKAQVTSYETKTRCVKSCNQTRNIVLIMFS